jgi:hypothetical protein
MYLCMVSLFDFCAAQIQQMLLELQVPEVLMATQSVCDLQVCMISYYIMLINLCFSRTCTTDLTLCSSALPLALYVSNTRLQDALKRDIATLLTLHKVATKRESDLMITKQQLQYQVSPAHVCQG